LQVGNDQEPLQVTAYTYIDQPDNPFEHGRKLRDEVTLNGKTTTTSYQYSKTAHVRNGEPVQHTVSTLTGFDGVMKSITSEHSLFTGEALLNQDDNDVKIAHEYDLLGRMTTEIVAPGTAYEASRTYTYKLTNKMGQQAEQYFTDVKDVCTRTLLDGLNRVVHEELIGSDPSDPERVIRTYSARYNARGQLSQDTVYDWWERDGLLEERALTTRYRYDDWGQEHRVTEPSGVVSVTQNDPITLEQLTWLESSDIEPRISNTTLTTTNLFEKPLKVQQLDGQQKPVSEREFFYDGLGNCVKQYDEMGEPTLFEYDPWSRLSSTTLPDGTRINRQYAEHSSASLPVSLKVNPNGNVEASPLLAGEQAFDGLDRLKYLSVGPRTLRYEYQGGSLQACKHITAKGQEIAYEYQSGLTDQPVGIMAADEHASFTYDPHSAQLLRTENDQGVYVFDHDKTGRLLGECWIEAGTTLQQTRYTSSPRGLPVSRTETDGLVTTYAYDLHGRVECVRQGQLQTTFSYDSLGQLQSTRNEDLSAGSVLLTGWEYDEQGREIQRTLSLNGQATRTLLQTYRPDNKLATRHLLEDSRSLLLETFTYDARGRLERYQCAGESLPRDRYGNAIVEQYFAFDALDNITHAWSTFEDGSSDEAVSGYATTDPCQLVNVTHTHADYLKEFPQGIHLHYDADGHLETDERGHYLRYDTQGRLLSVNEMTGSVISRYRYDGHNQLRGVKHRTGSETLRFYQDDRLSSTRQGDTCINYFYGDDQPVGQQTIGDDTQTLLFLTDAKHSLLGESQGDTLRAAVYGAYGERHSDVPMQSTLGFNGEIREDQHGWYLLGKGYRAYNPHLRRFHSPDSFSPFGSGGVNPYLYCVSDPINHIDPTGHAALQQYAYEAMGSKVDWGMIVQIGLMVALTAVSLYFAPGAAAALIGKASALTKLGAAANLLSTGAEATSTVTGVAAVVTNSSSLRKASVISGNAGMVGLVTPVTSVGRAFGKSIGKNSASSVRPRLSSNKYKPPADLSPDGAADPFRVSTIKARPPTPPPQPESNSPKPVRLSGEPQASVSHLSHTTDFSKLPSGDPPPVLKKTYPEEAAWHPLDGGWLRGSKVKEIQAEILTAHKQNRTPIIKHLYL
ncbi:RHS repeat-associated core domain-containing protein, partial [Pseudomonas sp. Irchel s3a18]|uniref:RHS repeat-associated core domain-containing protein n=1 Tax=Pseudomonas sp. Irchel s3a18 TaxID=2009053 RepID=UPI00117A9ED3